MTSAGPPAVHLIDASYFVFRAYYSVGLEMTDGDGQPVNALYGFGRFLGDLLEEARPEHVAVAFDESLATSFSNAIYPAYKKNREPAPPELKRQFGLCRELCRLLGLAEFGSPTHEADDIIGTIATRLRATGHRQRSRHARQGPRATRPRRRPLLGLCGRAALRLRTTSRASSACGRSGWRTTSR